MPSKTQSNLEANNLELGAETLNATNREDTKNDSSISNFYFSEGVENS